MGLRAVEDVDVIADWDDSVVEKQVGAENVGHDERAAHRVTNAIVAVSSAENNCCNQYHCRALAA